MLKVFRNLFTKERENNQLIQLKKLVDHFKSRKISTKILQGVDGTMDDDVGIDVLQDVFGSIAKISQCSSQEMVDQTPISTQAALKIEAYFHLDH
mmetsp:Transcript_9900/g.14888  ORF Transcript_9900/g.14888 Transcript_9900/m.14888 type:complete len:95 (-) Transcript_9900:68-352(-)